MRNKTLFVSAGEVSGDMHAADLMRALLDIDPEWKFFGMGGVKMREAGLQPIENDTSTLSAMGLTASIGVAGKVLGLFKKAMKAIRENPPAALVLVDNEGVNMTLAKEAKKLGIRVVYYFPPHVSIYGAGKAPKLAKTTDLLLVPFYPDYEVYRRYTEHVIFTGNPLLDRTMAFKLPDTYYSDQHLDPSKRLIALLPGSRWQEIKSLSPVFLEAAKLLLKSGEFHFVMPVSHPDYREVLRNDIETAGLSGHVTLTDGGSYEALTAASAVILSSGTASLEAALLGKPSVICYKISKLSFMIGKLLVKGGMVGFPNIVLGEKFLPELLQSDLTPENIAKETLHFLSLNAAEQKTMQDRLTLVRQRMGEPPVLKRTAQALSGFLNHG